MFRFFLIATILWMSFCFFSVIYSVDFSSSIYAYLKLSSLLFIFLGSIKQFDDPENFRLFQFAVLITCMLHATLGLMDFFQEVPIPATWIDPNLRDVIKTRSTGVFSDPNIFGGFFSFLIPFLITGFFKVTSGKLEFIWVTGIFLASLAVFTSFSRGAYISALFGILTLILIRKPTLVMTRKKKIFISLMIVLLIIFFAGPFKYRMFSIFKPTDMTFSQRTLINNSLFKAVSEVPTFGFGLHSFSQIYPRFRVVGGDYPLYAHNEYLQIFFESGPFSLIAFIFMTSSMLTMILSLVFRKNEVSLVTSSSCGAFIASLLHNFSSFSTRILPTSSIIALVCAGVFSKEINRDDSSKSEKRKWLILFLSAFSIFYLFFCYNCFKVASLLQNATSQLSSGKNNSALKLLAEAEKLDSVNPLIFYYRHLVFANTNLPKEAEASLDQAISVNPDEALFILAKARLYKKLNKEGADLFYEKAIKLDPAAEAFRLEYAKFLVEKGKPTAAIFQLEEALKSSPGFHDVYTTYLDVEKLKKELLLKVTENENFASSSITLYDEKEIASSEVQLKTNLNQ
ncbi:MAG: O-antigen ligase family protein [Candidatus Riflebacteria bacterium]|nr:O-antigen ligase family protein [Candidatus Riflebacteria bacterium]